MAAERGGSFMPDEDNTGSTDELLLTYLGSAVLLCWDELTPKAQLTILDQAGDVIGLTPIPDVRSRIVDLLLRRAKI
jgi:hypothetical protein